MRFSRDQGNGSFGQADPGVPGRMVPGSMMRPGGFPMEGATMPGGFGQGGGPANAAGGGFPPGAGRIPMGAPQVGVPPTGMPPMSMPPAGMPPSGMQGFGGMGQIPMQAPRPMMGGAPGGSIRNNLGSELKKRGFFQKDGQINNSRGGFFGPKPQRQQQAIPQGGGTMGTGPFSFLGNGGGAGGPGPGMPQARQFMLEAAQAGINANGIATISPDNVFSCIANLPSPNTLMGQGIGTYAAYLVDNKGQTGFLAGILRPAGNGVYQAQFRSQVPLAHYTRVMITVENPQHLGHVPQGPVILQVKQPMGPVRFLTPIKNAGGSAWKKLSGLIQRKPKIPVLPEAGPIPNEIVPPVNIEPPMGNPSIDPPINPMN